MTGRTTVAVPTSLRHIPAVQFVFSLPAVQASYAQPTHHQHIFFPLTLNYLRIFYLQHSLWSVSTNTDHCIAIITITQVNKYLQMMIMSVRLHRIGKYKVVQI